jgi:aryl-alcohol dehydrogenase-like predicted oxidoreductase
MEFRFLGTSGLKVSAISYGNWVTHGSQVEADQATACVRAALEAGITTFDTADTYANGAPRRFWAMPWRASAARALRS